MKAASAKRGFVFQPWLVFGCSLCRAAVYAIYALSSATTRAHALDISGSFLYEAISTPAGLNSCWTNNCVATPSKDGQYELGSDVSAVAKTLCRIREVVPYEKRLAV